jgi:hypothetical protein
VRPDSRWLAAGIACVGLSVWLRSGVALRPELRDEIAAALADPRDLDAMWAVLGSVTGFGLAVLAGGVLVIAVSIVLAATLLGRLGPIDVDAGRGLGMSMPPMRLRVAVGGAAVLAGAMAFDVQRRLAGGARAADASANALEVLWSHSATGSLLAIGVAMLVVGAAEAWQMRRDQIVALAPTPTQAADDARSATRRRA